MRRMKGELQAEESRQGWRRNTSNERKEEEEDVSRDEEGDQQEEEEEEEGASFVLVQWLDDSLTTLSLDRNPSTFCLLTTGTCWRFLPQPQRNIHTAPFITKPSS